MFLLGDSLTWLRQINDESVNTVITSPPYWALRDYKTEGQLWGGAPDCDHEWNTVQARLAHQNRNNNEGSNAKVFANPKRANSDDRLGTTSFCTRCNAWKGSLGLEPTFQLYIDHLVEIFDEVKRVLTNDGSCWVVLGDTYGSHKGEGGPNISQQTSKNWNSHAPIKGFEKSLLQIPQRFAIAMIDHGWILRNDLIWHKRNCMPSSARDRFTIDYEHVFFFVKSKKYYFKTQY